jgi:hypothetical protein
MAGLALPAPASRMADPGRADAAGGAEELTSVVWPGLEDKNVSGRELG